MESLFNWEWLLPELRALTCGYPIMDAYTRRNLALTCRDEMREYEAYYERHPSGPRKVSSLLVMGFLIKPSKHALDELCVLYERERQSHHGPGLYFDVWEHVIDRRAFDGFYRLWGCFCTHLDNHDRARVLDRVWWQWDVHESMDFLNLMEKQCGRFCWPHPQNITSIRICAGAELMGDSLSDISFFDAGVLFASLARSPKLRQKCAERIRYLSDEGLASCFHRARPEHLFELLVAHVLQAGSPRTSISRIAEHLVPWICESVHERWTLICALFPSAAIEFPLIHALHYTHRIYGFIKPLIHNAALDFQKIYLRRSLSNNDVGLVRMLLVDFPGLWSTSELYKPMVPYSGPLARLLNKMKK